MGLISLRLLGLIKCWGEGWLCKNIYLHLKKCRGGVMPKYFMDVKKCCGVSGVGPIYFRGLTKCGGGGMHKCLIDLKIPPDLQTTCS